jgi:hypothetical protein
MLIIFLIANLFFVACFPEHSDGIHKALSLLSSPLLQCRPSELEIAVELCKAQVQDFVFVYANPRGCRWALNCIDPDNPQECKCDDGYSFDPDTLACVEEVADCVFDEWRSEPLECPAFGHTQMPHPSICNEYTGQCCNILY